MIKHETQDTCSAWAESTFGPASSNARVAARANEEMAELLRALTSNDLHPKAGEEIADTVIVLYRLATRLGVDLQAEINRKMRVNRGRVWNVDVDGHGYHTRDKLKEAAPSRSRAMTQRKRDAARRSGGENQRNKDCDALLEALSSKPLTPARQRRLAGAISRTLRLPPGAVLDMLVRGRRG